MLSLSLSLLGGDKGKGRRPVGAAALARAAEDSTPLTFSSIACQIRKSLLLRAPPPARPMAPKEEKPFMLVALIFTVWFINNLAINFYDKHAMPLEPTPPQDRHRVGLRFAHPPSGAMGLPASLMGLAPMAGGFSGRRISRFQ